MFCRVFSWWMFQVQRINESCRARKMQKVFEILRVVGSSQGDTMYPMKVLMKYSRPNSCANPSLIARQERAGTEILLLGGVWNYSTILGSSSLGSRERGSIFAWYQVSPSKTLRDPPPPNQATSLHSQSRLSASMQRVLCACDECSTTSIYSDPKRFNTSIYSDPTQFFKKNMGVLGYTRFGNLLPLAIF